MAWETDLVLMTRVLINDLGTTQRHTDSYIQQVLVTAGVIAETEIKFSIDYTIDISGVTISPDPVVQGDLIFQSMVPLKSACILTQGDFQQAIQQGIKVRDGDSMVDTSVGFRGYRDILEFGSCAAYERLKWDIQSGKADGQTAEFVGGAVMTPSRPPNASALVTDIGLFFDRFASFLGHNCRSSRR